MGGVRLNDEGKGRPWLHRNPAEMLTFFLFKKFIWGMSA
jgi:hypothetical protein